jgi:hypothetical protein
MQTEIVMGVTNDERMEDRTQVILMITGLGAPTLEEAMRSLPKPAAAPVHQTTPLQASEPNARRGAQFAPQSAASSHSQPTASGVAGGSAHSPVELPASPAAAPARRLAELPPVSQNLDLPAFLRRRTRLAN